MPLYRGKKNVGRNIRTLTREGRPRRQAIAIALSVARRKVKKKRSRKRNGKA